ncbi:MAG: TRIC cation channel family protein [Cyanobacteria bacterium P01_G01_bin.38]
MFCTSFLYTLDLFSTAVFAASGALVAREQHHNSLIAVGYAILTAVGGGTLRDILLRQPIFWTKSPAYFLLAMSVGLFIFVFSAFARLRRRQLWLVDAIGLATFTIIGTQHVLQLPIAASLSQLMRWLPPAMGLMTGVGGGVVRDLLSCQMPYILKCPGYAVASFTGGSVYYVLASLQMPKFIAIGGAIATILFILVSSARPSHG